MKREITLVDDADNEVEIIESEVMSDEDLEAQLDRWVWEYYLDETV